MSLGDDSGSVVDFATMRGRDYPALRQFTVFLENRVGQLMSVLRRFLGSDVTIIALNIQDSTECCIVRFIFSHPEQGREILERAGLAMIEGDLIGLVLPDTEQPLLTVCNALLRAEVNLVQTYPLMVRQNAKMAIALMVDNIDMAQTILTDLNFSLLTENELRDMC